MIDSWCRRRGLSCIYFGRDGVALVLLLVGGSKASQTRDIRLAQVYWREYLGGK